MQNQPLTDLIPDAVRPPVQSVVDRIERLPWLSHEFLDNSLGRWIAALAVAVVVWIVVRIVLAILRRRGRQLTAASSVAWDDGIPDVLDATRGWFLLSVSLYAGAAVLHLDEGVQRWVDTAMILIAILQGAFWASAGLKVITAYVLRQRTDDPATKTTIAAVSFVGNLVLWSVVALLALDNLGVDVTAAVAGLGIGGIAVALAAQNILGDLFASLSIVVDRPFVLGDFIKVGDFLGTVEKIGLKTTRVRSLSGEQLIFANTDLLESRLRNYKRMEERRVTFKIGLVYETATSQLATVPGIIQEIVEEQSPVRFDRSHFSGFGDFSLDFETVYFVLTPDYNQYMDVQQAINLALHERMADQGMEFAYPTQTLLVAKAADQESV